MPTCCCLRKQSPTHWYYVIIHVYMYISCMCRISTDADMIRCSCWEVLYRAPGTLCWTVCISGMQMLTDLRTYETSNEVTLQVRMSSGYDVSTTRVTTIVLSVRRTIDIDIAHASPRIPLLFRGCCWKGLWRTSLAWLPFGLLGFRV